MNLASRSAVLARKRAELEERLSRIQRDLHRAEEPLPADSGERAVALENDQALEELETSTKAELAQVTHAIRWVAAGKGAQCEECGHVIEAERLHAVPHATRCRTCSGLQLPTPGRRPGKPNVAPPRSRAP